MTTVDTRGRAGRILRQRLTKELQGLPVVWGVILLGTAVLIAVVTMFPSSRIDTSGWEQAAQVARWWAGGLGVYITAFQLPLYVAHGYTRREFATGMPVVIVAFALVFGLLWALGYLIEAGVYGIFDWPQALTGTHLYESPTDFILTFVEFTLVAATWTVGGAMLGAAFYRNAALGLVLIPVALLLVSLVEVGAGAGFIGPLPLFDWWLTDQNSVGATTLVTLGVMVVGLGLTWVLVRTIPLKQRPS